MPRAICGMVTPIKAIGPVKAVDVPANRAVAKIIHKRVRETDTPSPVAYFSPSNKTLSFFCIMKANSVPTIMIGAMNAGAGAQGGSDKHQGDNVQDADFEEVK